MTTDEAYPIWISESLARALYDQGWLEKTKAVPSLQETGSVVLVYVCAHPDMATSDIAAHFGTTGDAMAMRLQRLARRGLIRVTYENTNRAKIARWRAT